MAEKHITPTKVTTTRHAGPITMPGDGREFLGDVLIPGAVLGLIGGTAMIVLYCLWTLGKGDGFWAPFKMMGGFFFRGAYLEDLGAGAAVLGIIIHYNVSIALATTWALLLPRKLGDTQFGVTALAPFYASLVWLVMTYFVLPYASQVMFQSLNFTAWWIVHLVWGGFLALVPQVRRTHYVFKQRMPVFLRRPVTV